MFTQAIVRKPGKNFAAGITSASLGTPDYELILTQHENYVQALNRLGLNIISLEAEPDYPDAYFVEDTAVVTPLVAVIARPGAPSRRGEEDSIEPVLARFRPTVRIRPPGTVDGGDVIMAENRFFIGLSARTNAEGARQLGRILKEHGHTWETVPAGVGLHLKSSVNYLGRQTLLVTQSFAGHKAFKAYHQIILDPAEEYAANTLWVNDCLLIPAGFEKTGNKLKALGLPVVDLHTSEARKMDGGLTCMSIRF
jgi:dimethylargininase